MLSYSLLFEFFRAFFALMEVLLLQHDMQRNLNKKKTRLKNGLKKICQSMLRDESLRECDKLFITHGQLVSQ